MLAFRNPPARDKLACCDWSGGVGDYPNSDFVRLDAVRPRFGSGRGTRRRGGI